MTATAFTDLVQIKNTVIDANNYISLQGVTFDPSYKKLITTYPLHGQNSGTNFVIAKADRTAVENPVFEIRGVINLADYLNNSHLWNTAPSTIAVSGEEGVSMTNVVTLGYLMAIWRNLTGTTYLRVSWIVDGKTFNWYSNDIGSIDIPIEIETIAFRPRVDSDNLHFIDYTISCKEVRLT